MPRIAGVDIPPEKRIDIALSYIYGIGKNNVHDLLRKADVNPDKRVKDISDQDILRLQKVIDKIPHEGTLRKILSENVKRLKQIGSYRGKRHLARLPARGQRTRSNARTKRGKRATVGALRKEMLQKLEKVKKKGETS